MNADDSEEKSEVVAICDHLSKKLSLTREEIMGISQIVISKGQNRNWLQSVTG